MSDELDKKYAKKYEKRKLEKELREIKTGEQVKDRKFQEEEDVRKHGTKYQSFSFPAKAWERIFGKGRRRAKESKRR